MAEVAVPVKVKVEASSNDIKDPNLKKILIDNILAVAKSLTKDLVEKSKILSTSEGNAKLAKEIDEETSQFIDKFSAKALEAAVEVLPSDIKKTITGQENKLIKEINNRAKGFVENAVGFLFGLLPDPISKKLDSVKKKLQEKAGEAAIELVGKGVKKLTDSIPQEFVKYLKGQDNKAQEEIAKFVKNGLNKGLEKLGSQLPKEFSETLTGDGTFGQKLTALIKLSTEEGLDKLGDSLPKEFSDILKGKGTISQKIAGVMEILTGKVVEELQEILPDNLSQDTKTKDIIDQNAKKLAKAKEAAKVVQEKSPHFQKIVPIFDPTPHDNLADGEFDGDPEPPVDNTAKKINQKSIEEKLTKIFTKVADEIDEKTSELIKETLDKASKKLPELVKKLGEKIDKKIPEVLVKVAEKLDKETTELTEIVAKKALDKAVGFIPPEVQKFLKGEKNTLAEDVSEYASEKVSGLANALLDILPDSLVKKLKIDREKLGKQISEAITKAVPEALEKLKGLVPEDFIKFLKGEENNVLEKVSGFIRKNLRKGLESLADFLPTDFSKALKAEGSIGQKLANVLKLSVEKGLTFIGDFLPKDFSGILTGDGSIGQKISGVFGVLAEKGLNFFKSFFPEGKNPLKEEIDVDNLAAEEFNADLDSSVVRALVEENARRNIARQAPGIPHENLSDGEFGSDEVIENTKEKLLETQEAHQEHHVIIEEAQQESITKQSEADQELLNNRIEGLNQLKEANVTAFDEIKSGAGKFLAEASKVSVLSAELFGNLANAMQVSLSKNLTAMLQGTKSFSEAFKSFISDMASAFISQVGAMIAKWLALQAVTGIFNSLGFSRGGIIPPGEDGFFLGRSGEGILTPEAVLRVGGEAGLTALNNGAPSILGVTSDAFLRFTQGVPTDFIGPIVPQTGFEQFGTNVIDGLGSFGGAVGSFIGGTAGNLLASELFAPSTESSLGGLTGGIAGSALAAGTSFLANSALLGAAGGPIGIAIGAFLGTLAGSGIGAIFGGTKLGQSEIEIGQLITSIHETRGVTQAEALALARLEKPNTGSDNISDVINEKYEGFFPGTGHLRDDGFERESVNWWTVQGFSSLIENGLRTRSEIEAGLIQDLVVFKGKFQSGLDFVPFDNFPALLHRGERVLTSEENRNFNPDTTELSGFIISLAERFIQGQERIEQQLKTLESIDEGMDKAQVNLKVVTEDGDEIAEHAVNLFEKRLDTGEIRIKARSIDNF